MSIKILGGFAKSFTVKTPKTYKTRPTSVMLRRKLFDSFQDLSGFEFVDFCAGSGSVGLEASSRGADKVYLNDTDPVAYKVLGENALEFKKKYPTSEIKVSKKKFLSMLRDFEFKSGSEYFLFFDPPYEKQEMYEDFFNAVKEIQFNGYIVVEACKQKTMNLEEFEQKFQTPDKLYKQGTSFFAVYKIEMNL